MLLIIDIYLIMKKICFSFLLAMVMISAVCGQKKKEITTPVTVNYCLPKVSYRVVVTLEYTQLLPGPYRQYAEKQLGLKPEIVSPGEEWKIKNIDIVPQYVPDEKAMYAITASGDYHPVLLSLSPEGFLAGVSAGPVMLGKSQPMSFQMNQEEESNDINIIHFNTYNHLKEILDTNYTFQEVDGVMKKIWDPNVRYVAKNEEDNISEAVREIFRIRSERVKLLASENQVPDGKSLEIILKEFDQMERNYLSLFMGKQETMTVVKVFDCVPEKSGEPVVAFRFSEEEGVVGRKNVTGVAYSLQVTNTVVPATTTPASSTAGQSVIFYRVPAVGELKLMRASEELRSFKAIVPQLGEIKVFPTDIISNEGLSLEFYPEYGALKSVNKK